MMTDLFLKSLYLKNFRLYKEATFEFSPGVNVIYGPNALGKTTILEAIYLLISGRSFRTSQLADLISHGSNQFFVAANFVKYGIEQSLKFAYDGKTRRIIYNNTPCKTATSLYGLISGVSMTPDDVSLIKAGPIGRRQFLDIQLAQADPLYVHYLSRYARAVKQRNLLLKKRDVATIFSWEAEMAKAAAYIVSARRTVSSLLQKSALKVQRALSAQVESLDIRYKTSAPLESIEEYYLDMWKRHRPRELDAKMTLSGPHRDDLQILVSESEARYYASEGQQRSAVVALKLGGWEQLKQRLGVPPLMLVDDVGISFDSNRKKQLFSYLLSLNQVFLSATEDLDIPGKKLGLFDLGDYKKTYANTKSVVT